LITSLTHYDHNEFISLIKQAFKEELKEILTQKEKESDYDVLFTRKEEAELLKVSVVTISKYQKQGRFPYCRLGRYIYFKKGDIMKGIEIPIKHQHRKWSNY
jgi:predicted house-cleaning noncanonical NTP pyrophosphatase (MazG superfamily)